MLDCYTTILLCAKNTLCIAKKCALCYNLAMKTHDKDIRPLLFDFLDERYGKVRTFEELYIGDCRADVYAVIDGAAVGFEIKSDSDTYARLEKQVKLYSRYCDYCYAVVGSTHTKILEHVPEFWGVISVCECDGELSLSVIREAKISPKVKSANKLRVLWRRELNALLALNSYPKYANKSRKFVIDYIVEKTEEEALAKQISDILFERDYTVFENSAPKKRVRNRMSSVRMGKRAARKRAK